MHHNWNDTTMSTGYNRLSPKEDFPQVFGFPVCSKKKQENLHQEKTKRLTRAVRQPRSSAIECNNRTVSADTEPEKF